MKLQFWYSPKGMVILVLLSFAGYIFFREHQSHILQALPNVILLLCPLMHIFMHDLHRNHGENVTNKEIENEAYRRGYEEGGNNSLRKRN